MNDSRLVRMVQRIGNLRRKLDRFPRREKPGSEPVSKCHPLHEVTDDVQLAAFLPPNFVDGDDAGMTKLGRGTRLAEEGFFFPPG